MRYVTDYPAELIELHLAVLHHVRQGLINDGEETAPATPIGQSVPPIGIDTGQRLFGSGVGFVGDGHDIAVR
ncbi:hypothetical protein [Bradyrhizobium sp. LMG 9283]|uniref:hypothetical protein n=1 Tax=Bradyrhizobium sp. LMG 9283 TaxID=592064 RepID=UPI0038908250